MFSLWGFFMMLALLAAIIMIGLVLLQQGKGADMGSSFGAGASGSLFGATGSANPLSKATAVAATVFFASTLALTYLGSQRQSVAADKPVDSVLNTVGAGAVPAAATAASAAAGSANGAANNAVPASAAPPAPGAAAPAGDKADANKSADKAAADAAAAKAAEDAAKATAADAAKAPDARAGTAPDANTASIATENGVVKFFFATAKADVAAGADAALKAVAAGAKAGKKVVVSGYTDSTGSAAVNADLAKRRAQAVQAALLKAGVDAKSIELKKPQTVQAGDGAAARRVEVSLQ